MKGNAVALHRNEDARVAITGAGVVTPVGVGLSAFAEALRQGRQQLVQLADVPTPRGKSAFASVDDPRFAGTDRAYRMATAAIAEAMRMADFAVGAGEDVGLILSTISGESAAVEAAFAQFDTAAQADPALRDALCRYPNGALLNQLGVATGCFGPRLVVTNACASGNIALGLALDLIRQGHCRAVVVVGVEIMKLSTVWGAERAGFIGRVLRPFHAQRDGSILGEGAGALILEREAGQRPLLGWLEGYGCVCDRGAAPITLLEDGSGLRRAMSLALADGGREPGDVEYVNAHAPGTRMIDLIECKAVADLCGDHAATVAVNATKSLTAHLAAASAVVEAIAVLIQMHAGFIHPTCGLDTPEPELALQPVGVHALERRVTRSLSNACGGGGLNTALLLTAASAPPAARSAPRTDSIVIGVTGIGTISALGAHSADLLTIAATVDRPCAGRLEWFDSSQWFPAETRFAYVNRAAQLAAAAAALALGDARLDPTASYRDDRVAVIAGTAFGGEPAAAEAMCRGLQCDPPVIKPSMALDNGIHLGAALICRFWGLTGPTYTLTGSAVAGLNAVAAAADLLRTGRADMAIVLGYDAMDPALRRALTLLGSDPGADRCAEGAGALVLERLDAARARNAPRFALLPPARLLSADLSRPNALGRLVARLDAWADQWDSLYLAAPPDPRLDRIAALLMQRAGRRGMVQRLDDRTGHCFAADPLLALSTVVARGERALVLALESGGSVGAQLVAPC